MTSSWREGAQRPNAASAEGASLIINALEPATPDSASALARPHVAHAPEHPEDANAALPRRTQNVHQNACYTERMEWTPAAITFGATFGISALTALFASATGITAKLRTARDYLFVFGLAAAGAIMPGVIAGLVF